MVNILIANTMEMNIPSIMCFFSDFFSIHFFLVFIRSRLILRSMYFFDSSQSMEQESMLSFGHVLSMPMTFFFTNHMWLIQFENLFDHLNMDWISFTHSNAERKSKTIARLDLCLYKCDQWYGRDDNNVATSGEKKMMTATTTTKATATMHRTYRITK